MAQSAQSNPVVTANLAGEHHQVNLRDYLNARIAPFLKKAITESLDASPQFPLQWLGENLIHQSILYEGNPDSTNIRERFVYKFNTPAPEPQTSAEVSAAEPQQPAVTTAEEPVNSTAITNGEPLATTERALDTQMSNHINGEADVMQNNREREGEPNNLPADTEMADTS